MADVDLIADSQVNFLFWSSGLAGKSSKVSKYFWMVLSEMVLFAS